MSGPFRGRVEAKLLLHQPIMTAPELGISGGESLKGNIRSLSLEV